MTINNKKSKKKNDQGICLGLPVTSNGPGKGRDASQCRVYFKPVRKFMYIFYFGPFCGPGEKHVFALKSFGLFLQFNFLVASDNFVLIICGYEA